MKGLIIKSPHIEKILDGTKTWEIRGSATTIRGKIALIKSGTKTIVGYAHLIKCVEMNPETFYHYEHLHHATGFVNYKKIYAWVLRGAEKLETPVPYEHPQGAIIWVNL